MSKNKIKIIKPIKAIFNKFFSGKRPPDAEIPPQPKIKKNI